MGGPRFLLLRWDRDRISQILLYLKKKDFTAPFYGWGSSDSRLQSHYEDAVYFLPLPRGNSYIFFL